jgi:hypothetical protein
MKKEEYITKRVVLYGYGPLNKIKLDAQFFKDAENDAGEISNVLEISKGFGGIGGFFGSGEIEGRIILFKSGSAFCAQSDGEYVDMCMAKAEESKEVKK